VELRPDTGDDVPVAGFWFKGKHHATAAAEAARALERRVADVESRLQDMEWALSRKEDRK
jgi:hypothetical protein